MLIHCLCIETGTTMDDFGIIKVVAMGGQKEIRDDMYIAGSDMYWTSLFTKISAVKQRVYSYQLPELQL